MRLCRSVRLIDPSAPFNPPLNIVHYRQPILQVSLQQMGLVLSLINFRFGGFLWQSVAKPTQVGCCRLANSIRSAFAINEVTRKSTFKRLQGCPFQVSRFRLSFQYPANLDTHPCPIHAYSAQRCCHRNIPHRLGQEADRSRDQQYCSGCRR